MKNYKTFIHYFSDGREIKLVFDLSNDSTVTCESSMIFDGEPMQILNEYEKWRRDIVVPTLLDDLSVGQLSYFIKKGTK
jgi:hypothetical protein